MLSILRSLTTQDNIGNTKKLFSGYFKCLWRSDRQTECNKTICPMLSGIEDIIYSLKMKYRGKYIFGTN